MTTLHAEISIVPIGTGSTGISKEVAAAFDAIRKTKDIKTTKLTAMGTQVSQVSYLMSSYHLPNVLSRYSDIAVFCSSI